MLIINIDRLIDIDILIGFRIEGLVSYMRVGSSHFSREKEMFKFPDDCYIHSISIYSIYSNYSIYSKNVVIAIRVKQKNDILYKEEDM